MGYKAEQLRFGFTMATPTFVNVAGADKGIDLYDLVAGGSYASGDISVQTLNYDGSADKNYTFRKDRKGNWYWWDENAGDTVERGTVFFTTGQGLWVNGVDEATLTNSGAVSTDDNVIQLRFGFTASGNMTPIALDLTSLIPGGEYSSGDISVQTLNYDGSADKNYTFRKDRKGNWYWWDENAEEAVEAGNVTFSPGEGLWINGVDGATLTFPGPTL